jgi:hypothetical protein
VGGASGWVSLDAQQESPAGTSQTDLISQALLQLSGRVCTRERRSHSEMWDPRKDSHAAMQKLRIVTVGNCSRGRFATAAEFPLLECSPYSHVHVRRERLGFVLRQGPLSVAPCLTLTLRFAFIAVCPPAAEIERPELLRGSWWYPHGRAGLGTRLSRGGEAVSLKHAANS